MLDGREDLPRVARAAAELGGEGTPTTLRMTTLPHDGRDVERQDDPERSSSLTVTGGVKLPGVAAAIKMPGGMEAKRSASEESLDQAHRDLPSVSFRAQIVEGGVLHGAKGQKPLCEAIL
jgi:hypothetical protein